MTIAIILSVFVIIWGIALLIAQYHTRRLVLETEAYRRRMQGRPEDGMLSLEEQRDAILSVWPQLTCTIHKGRLSCTGRVQPSPITSNYRIRIEYEIGVEPKVWIEDPPLKSRSDEEPIPYIYRDRRPGLFRPGDWHGRMNIATTVVPWILLWLLFYEGWHATGQWHGGGEHPSKRT